MASEWAYGRARVILPERLHDIVVAKTKLGDLAVVLLDAVAACLDEVRMEYETSDLTIAVQERAEFRDQRDALAKRVRELEALLSGDVVEAARIRDGKS